MKGTSHNMSLTLHIFCAYSYVNKHCVSPRNYRICAIKRGWITQVQPSKDFSDTLSLSKWQASHVQQWFDIYSSFQNRDSDGTQFATQICEYNGHFGSCYKLYLLIKFFVEKKIKTNFKDFLEEKFKSYEIEPEKISKSFILWI